MGKSETPVVSFDYAFVGDRHKQDNKEDVEVKEDADDEEAMVKATVLVGRDAKSRVCCAIPLPQKGVDMAEWSGSARCQLL